MVERKKGAGSILGVSGAKGREVADIDATYGTINTKDPYGSSNVVINPDGSRTIKTQLSKDEKRLKTQGDRLQKQSLGGARDILGDWRKDYGRGFDVTQGVNLPTGGDYSNIGNFGNIDPSSYGNYSGESGRDSINRAGQTGGLDFTGRDWAGQNFDDILGKANQYSDQTFDRFSQKMQPEFQRQQEGLTESMINRGIATGSNPYQRSVQSLSEQQNRSLLDARNMADLQGQQLAVQGGNLASQNLRNYADSILGGVRANQAGGDLNLRGSQADFDIYNRGQQTNLDAQKLFYDNSLTSDDLRLRAGQQGFQEGMDLANFGTKANLTNYQQPLGAISTLGGVGTSTNPESTPQSATYNPPNFGQSTLGFEGISQSARNNAGAGTGEVLSADEVADIERGSQPSQTPSNGGGVVPPPPPLPPSPTSAPTQRSATGAGSFNPRAGIRR